jgi:hypothetical protein
VHFTEDIKNSKIDPTEVATTLEREMFISGYYKVFALGLFSLLFSQLLNSCALCYPFHIFIDTFSSNILDKGGFEKYIAKRNLETKPIKSYVLLASIPDYSFLLQKT